MERFVCIHGHFYQPPRENAWLEVIEQQDSAYPFHDWNERISFECYGPNAYSRILNNKGEIIDIVNNYSRMSFNFGPTLLHWMKENAQDIYKAILAADKQSIKLNEGHGSAVAQVYNHMILPLAKKRDKETQVIWGIKDFEKRFGRKPKGMWLAETAVDYETLDVLAENDIEFTILAPRQAKSVKKNNSGTWTDVSGEKIDTRRPYLCKLPSGKTISLFFYNGSVSQEVAFKGILKDGKAFAEKLLDVLDENTGEPQLSHIATDGESYGHHHLHGDMALAFCMDVIEKSGKAKLINYSHFLSKFPPQYEVEIFENSSWSCVHGIERWRSDCGCNTGGNLGWNQQWRAPLREALDWLAEKLNTVYEEEMKAFHSHPWTLRNAYIDIILDRNETAVNNFIFDQCKIHLNNLERTKFLRLLEMQRQVMLMYTSCAWFFDEVSGIETIQVLQYADRAIQLAESETSKRFTQDFLEHLSRVKSNVAEYENASKLHEEKISPSRLSLSKVGMHYAVASLFEEFPEVIDICNYKAESVEYERLEAGIFKLAIGRTKVYSNITYSEKEFCFAVIYLGQNHLIGNSSNEMEAEKFQSMKNELMDAFNNSMIADVIGIMQTYFGAEKFSLWSLFKDEQRKVIQQIVKKDINQAEQSYKKIYNRNYDIMNVMKNAGIPVPQLFLNNLEMVINLEMKDFFRQEKSFTSKLEKLSNDAKKWEIKLDKEEIGFAASQKLLQVIEELRTKAFDLRYIASINRVLKVLENLEIKPDVWKSQNGFFYVSKKLMEALEKSELSMQQKNDYLNQLYKLGDYLRVKI